MIVSALSLPLTFPIRPTSSTTAVSFLISSTKALTCLHACSHHQPPEIVGYPTTIYSSCPSLDLAILSLPPITSLEKYTPPTFTKPRALGLHYLAVLPLPKPSIPLSLISLSNVTYVYSNTCLPALLFRSLSSDINFYGTSGSPVVDNFSGQVVGMIVQASGSYVHVVPSCYFERISCKADINSVALVPSYFNRLKSVHGIQLRTMDSIRYGSILGPISMAIAKCNVNDIVSIVVDSEKGIKKLRVKLQAANRWDKRVVSVGPFYFGQCYKLSSKGETIKERNFEPIEKYVSIIGIDVTQAMSGRWISNKQEMDELFSCKVNCINGNPVIELSDLLVDDPFEECTYQLDNGKYLRITCANQVIS